LRQCLTSIREAGEAYICVVAPPHIDLTDLFTDHLIDQRLDDPTTGLATAIDYGLRNFPSNIEFINWLGDDDLLCPRSISLTVECLRLDPYASMVYGGCNYIDEDGNPLWTNKSGRYAKVLMRCGPQLIPQPGALFRRDAYEQIGGLNSQYKWAFDLDLFLRLSKWGKFHFIPHTLANFRWHDGSLSVGGRQGSVKEASEIRTAALPKQLRSISPIWEWPLRKIILYAGRRITRRAAM
jgi:hypothetical protein